VGKPRGQQLKVLYPRLELIQFKVINFCTSTFDFDMCLFYL